MKLFILATLVAGAAASCANDCNGHGTCNVYSACECYRNWMGADCSERVCYFGHAFVDTPQGDLNADGRTDVTTATWRVILGSNFSFFAQQDNAVKLVTRSYMGRASPTWNAVTGKTEGVTKSSFNVCQAANGDYQDGCGTNASAATAHAIENDIITEYTLDSTLSSYASNQQSDIYGYTEACQAATQSGDATIVYTIAFDIETDPSFTAWSNGNNVKALSLFCEEGYLGRAADAECDMGTDAASSLLAHGADSRKVELCTMYSSTYSVQWSNKKEWERYPTDHGYATDGAKTVWDEAHFYRECSNKGTCNRQSGTCECYAGYEGEGCTRTACPNACSGHGTCRRLIDINDAYVSWDAYKTQSCLCDNGYTGPDCSLRICPSGDDPISRINDRNEIQTVTFADKSKAFDHAAPNAIAAAGDAGAGLYFALDFEDEFGDRWLTKSVNLLRGTAAQLASDVEAALEALPNNVIEDVEVSAAINTNEVVFAVTFLHNSGDIPMMGARYSFGYGNDAAASATKENTATGYFAGTPFSIGETTKGNKENVQCSNRGLCDQASGLCKCFAGYTDYDCSIQNALSSS